MCLQIVFRWKDFWELDFKFTNQMHNEEGWKGKYRQTE